MLFPYHSGPAPGTLATATNQLQNAIKTMLLQQGFKLLQTQEGCWDNVIALG